MKGKAGNGKEGGCKPKTDRETTELHLHGFRSVGSREPIPWHEEDGSCTWLGHWVNEEHWSYNDILEGQIISYFAKGTETSILQL